ncbi:MAG: ShlB/FhaC/HecB family hemolysin secretion/activation protein [Proteobacteria bacterium]|nr:ShlB/FhaC/HecB family hemolysin secretion/activation protein [Pseudomonadota bacterium]
MSRSTVGAVGALILALIATPAMAQNYKQVAPPQPPAPPPPRISVPPAPVLRGGSTRTIIPLLRGIRLVAAPAGVVPAGARTVGVTSAGIAFGPELGATLHPFLDRPASFATLRAIEARIVGLYRAKGHPFVNVVLPRQDIASGIVQFVVAEYRVDKVTVRGNQWFATPQIRAGLRIAPGDTIDINRVTDDLGWLNVNPFRQVDLLASPGSLVGTTDLNLVVHDRLPFAVSAGYDNSGNATTGFDRWKLGFLAGNVFGRGVLLGYQFIASDDFFSLPRPFPGPAGGPRFIAHSISWTVPLAWHDTVRVFGDYERVAPSLPSGFASVGHSGQASLRYDRHLPTLGRLVQQVSFGYDFKTSDNNIAFGGTTVFGSSAEIDQFPVIYSATLPDRFGETTVIPRIVLSPGGLTAGNTDSAYQPGPTQGGVAYARASYVYVRLDAVRRTPLPGGFEWRMRLTTQISSTNLLPSEQLSIGGLGTVRGYPTYIAGGSEGVILGEELRGPPIRLLARLGIAALTDRFRPDVFWDYAHVFDLETIPGTPRAIDLTSLGVGGHYTMSTGLDVVVQAGTEFHPVPGHQQPGGFVNVSVQMTL